MQGVRDSGPVRVSFFPFFLFFSVQFWQHARGSGGIFEYDEQGFGKVSEVGACRKGSDLSLFFLFFEILSARLATELSGSSLSGPCELVGSFLCTVTLEWLDAARLALFFFFLFFLVLWFAVQTLGHLIISVGRRSRASGLMAAASALEVAPDALEAVKR